MQRVVYCYSLCFIALCATLSSCVHDVDCLTRVDRAIDMRPEYELAHRAQIDSIESTLALCATDSSRFDTYNGIFELFRCNDIDSADFYVEKMAGIRDDVFTRAAKASVLSSRKNYARAFELLDDVNRDRLSDRELLTLYDSYQSVCSAVNNDQGVSDAERQLSREKKIRYQQSTLLLQDLTPFEKFYYKGRLLASENHPAEAIDMLQKALIENPEPQKAIHCTFAIAGCFKELGDMDGYVEMLCETALLDFSICNRQYSSLYDLALYLYGQGDFNRASNYIQTTIIDAIQCNYNTRIINAVDAQNIITAASLQRERSRKRILYAGFLMLVCFSMVVSILYIRIRRRNYQIKSINNKVRELNGYLKEEGVIKDRYLFRYMTLTVQFIKNIEDYRRLLRKTLKEEGIESLKEKLSQQEYLYMQYDTFYINCPTGSVYTNKANLKVKLGCEDSSLEKLLLEL